MIGSSSQTVLTMLKCNKKTCQYNHHDFKFLTIIGKYNGQEFEIMSFPGGSDGKESACNAGETWVRSLGWEDPLEDGMATHSSILAWRIPMDRGDGRATVHGVAKSQTRLSD